MREEERPTNRGKLDSPLVARRSFAARFDPEVFGHLSERVARFIGSWRFVAYMTVFIIAWVLWNVLAEKSLRPDAYPFIFLTLLLSLQASYAAPLILLAQNRQADRDRVTSNDDRARTERIMAEMEYLSREIAALRIAMGDVVTRDFLRGELRELLEEIAEERPEQPNSD